MRFPCGTYYVSSFELSGSDLRVRFITSIRLRSDSFAIEFCAFGVRNTSEVIDFLNSVKISGEDLYIYSQDGESILSCHFMDDEEFQIHSMTTSCERAELMASEFRAELAFLQHMYDHERQIILELRDKLQNVKELTLDRLAWLTASHSNCEVGTEVEKAYAKAISLFQDIRRETGT